MLIFSRCVTVLFKLTVTVTEMAKLKNMIKLTATITITEK